MPVEIISLLSSPARAPRPNPQPPSPDHNAPLRSRPNPPATRRCHARPSPEPDKRFKQLHGTFAHSDDFLFLSDDFGTTGDLARAVGEAEDKRATKKARLTGCFKDNDGSRRSPARIASSVARLDGAAVLQPARPKIRHNTADPIELTSSPDPGCATSPRRLTNAEYDPFGSSSPRAKDNEATNKFSRPTANRDPFTSPRQLRKADAPKTSTAWDPISSSAPETCFANDYVANHSPRKLSRSRSEVIELGDSDVDALSQPSSDEEFPDIQNIDLSKPKSHILAAKRAPKPQKPRTTARKPSTKNKSQRGEESAALRAADKERKRREKEREKEQRAREKERAAALAEVNKIRTDKKVSTPEMIVDLPSTLDSSIRLQAETLLRDLDVQHHSWDSPVADVIKWRRKVTSVYDSELGRWEPIPARIEEEKHAMVLLPAADFVKLVLGAQGANLEAHVLKIQRHFPDHTLIYLIDGLTPWMRKNRNVRNRHFQSAVRNAGDDTGSAVSGSQQQPRRRKNNEPEEYIDEDTVEDALLQLQVIHSVLIHHTNAAVEAARWIAVFTQHISTIPYRLQREQLNDGAGFCMESGQVRTGDDARDIYVRMLQEIARVTMPIAYGIAAEFDSVAKLVRGLEEGGPLALDGCRRSSDKEGTVSDRTIGQAMSRRIYKVFTGQDEASTDV